MKPRKVFGWLVLLFQIILLLKLVEYAQGDVYQSQSVFSPVKVGTVFPIYTKGVQSQFREENIYQNNKEDRASPLLELYHILTGQADFDFQENHRQTTTKTTYVPVFQIATGAAMAAIWYFIFIRVWKDPLISDFGQTSPSPSIQATTPKMELAGPSAQGGMWNLGDSYSVGGGIPGSDAYSHLMYGQEKYGS